MSYELAKAYVQIIPTTKGIKGELESALGGAGDKAGQNAGSGFMSGFGSVIGGAAKVAGAAIVAAGAAMTAFTKSSVEAGMQFDSAMSQVAATMGTTVDEIGDLRSFAKEMGATTAFSATEAAEALNYMALAGYDSKKAMEMLPNVLNLAAAGGIDLASASDMVTDAASALGLETAETTTMVDQMAKASSKSNTSVAQLGEAFLKIGATARNLSGGTQELSTMLGVLADNGIKGAEGGTHLRNILLSLQSAAEDGTVDFGDFSVAVYDSDGNMRSMVDIVKDMQAGLGDMSQESKDAITSGVFNKTDLAAINALLGTSEDRFDELYDSIGDCSGAAQNMADTQLDNLAGDITLMQSAFEGLKIAVSDGVTPSIRDAVQGITGIIDGMNDLVSGVEGGGEKIRSGFMQIVNGISEGIPTVIEIFKSIFSGVIEVLPTILPDIMTALFDGIVFLVESVDISELVTGVFDCMNSITKAIVPRIPELLGQIVVGIVKAIPDLFMGIAETVYTTFDALFGGYNEFDKFKDKIDGQTKAWDGVTSAMANAKSEIENDAQTWSGNWDMLQNITDESGKVKSGYEGMAQMLIDQLNEALGLNIELIDGQIKDYDTLCSSIDAAIEKKRAELILAAEEEAYAEALKMRPELVQAVTEAETNRAAAQAEVNRLEAEYDSLVASGADLTMWTQAHDEAIVNLADMNAAYDQAAANLSSNTAAMSQYMNDYTAVMENDYSAIGSATATFTGNTYQDLVAYQTKVAKQLDADKTEHDAWLSNYAEFGTDFAKEQADMYAKRIETDRTQLEAINKLVEQEGENFDAGYVKSILNGEKDVESASKTITEGALDGVKNTQDSNSPSRVTQGYGKDFTSGYSSGITSLASTVVSAASGLASSATSSLNNYSSAYSAGTNTGSGFADGIGAMADYVWSRARSLASSALSSIKSALGISSPSREMMWVGQMFDEGLALGISGSEDIVTDAVRDINEGMMYAVSPDAGTLNSIGTASAKLWVDGNLSDINRGPITVNVYGSEGQSVEALADEVIDRLQMTIIGSEAIYA